MLNLLIQFSFNLGSALIEKNPLYFYVVWLVHVPGDADWSKQQPLIVLVPGCRFILVLEHRL